MSQYAIGLVIITVMICQMLFMLHNRVRSSEQLQERVALLQRQNETTKVLLEKQQELARNQRLETIGSMTSAISHEFNNLLTPIMGYSLMCLEKLPEDSELSDSLTEIYSAAEKAKNIVSRLSALTRKNTGVSYTDIVPDELVRKVLDFVYPSRPETVTMKTDLHCGTACLHANETQVMQVVLNLILNAFQAMEKTGGVVTVSTCLQEGKVIFTVKDNGPGMTPEVQERIFEPFFTTKEAGKGSGLGLAVAKQVMEAHGGSITVQSRQGEGAAFTLSFAAKAEETEEAK